MRAAVTGASGFVGRHLVRRLLDNGCSVTALRHSRGLSQSVSETRLTMVEGSVEDPSGLAAAFEGADVVYHLVGLIVETRAKTFGGTVVEGTQNVVTACRKAGVRLLVYLSAMGTTAGASGGYFRSKYLAEEAVRGSGLDFVILRPSLIYGDGDGFVSTLARLIRSTPIVPVLGSGRYLLQPLYIDDLTKVLAQIPDVGEAAAQTIELGGPEKLEYREILDIIRRHLGLRRLFVNVPMSLAKLGAVLLEGMMKPAPVTRDQLTMLESGSAGDNSKAQRMFGIQPVSFEKGLRKYLR